MTNFNSLSHITATVEQLMSQSQTHAKIRLNYALRQFFVEIHNFFVYKSDRYCKKNLNYEC